MNGLALLLIQLLIILAVARCFGWLFERMRQPRVIGEMTAGIVLGPTVLGAFAPFAFHTVFPSQSLSVVQELSQIGLVLYIFYVGLELDTKVLRAYRRTAMAVSSAGIIVPFTLGALLAWHIHGSFESERVPALTFALFIGVAMSITAFPVLVRILQEQGLMQSRLGIVAVASAAIDDVTAWCLLAAIIALARSGSSLTAWRGTLLPLLLYLAAMLLVARPLLHRLAHRTLLPLSAAYLIALASASFTEVIGIHALFGAFVAGLIYPRNQRTALESQILPVASLLLPLFFAFSGLRTAIPWRGGLAAWGYGLLILLVAVVGKAGTCALVARCTGLTWRESGALGALMNTRGLIELIILNIGLDMGVISQTLFSLLVFMALLTTFMTVPLLRLIYAGEIPGMSEKLSEPVT